MNITCAMGKIFIGYVTKRYFGYKTTMILIVSSILINLIIFLLVLQTKNIILIYLVSGILGFFA